MKTKIFTFSLALFASMNLFAQSGTCGPNLTWTLQNGVLTISGSGNMDDYQRDGSPWYSYLQSITSITIPNSVTSIGNYAFYYCDGLTSITIPNSVTSIGEGAFFQCSGLTSVTIPNSVTSIGNSAFSCCSGLTSVTIPNSVTSIGDAAFDYCFGLTSITIPNSVTSIGSSAFYYCSGLTSATIGNSVRSIGNYAFSRCSSLTSITIPNSVTSIGNGAFYYCTGLTSITIPNSVTSIGERAFEYCFGLTSVHISDIAAWCGITFIYGDSNPLYYAKHLYLNENEVTNLIIPNSVTSIGDYAFRNCSGLTSITIPNSVTSIGDYAFSGCSGLTSVTIPNSVTSIGEGAFQNCSGLTSVTIPNSVISIGNSAFLYCSSLTSVTIPNSVISIGNYAFENCNRLDSVIWNARNAEDFNTSPFNSSSGRVKVLILGDSVQHIPANLCNGFNRIKEITIPDNVETIGSSVFVGCDSLTRVNITNLTTWCGTDFTATSTPLRTAELYINGVKPQRIDVPNGLTKVGSFSLINCSQLTEVLLPPSVTEIGESAFAGGSRLQTVTLDANLTTIGDSAFNNCPYLITVNANMEFPPLISSSVFANCGDLSYVDCNVPQNSLGLYRKTAVWSSFSLHGTPTFTVSFVDWDNTPITSQTVLQGTDATAPDNPTRDGYTFTGWSANFTNVQSDLTIIAQYEQDTPSDYELIEEGDSLSTSVRKIFENGHFYILLPDGTRYDATGRKIE